MSLFAIAMLGVVSGRSVAMAEGPTLPGMCNGSKAPNTLINAQAHSGTKFILNVATDAAGVPLGVMIIGKGADRVYVDQICRVWVHVPGQTPGGDDGHGDEGQYEEGATVAHAVGVATLSDGRRALVRADVRSTEEGTFFMARYRVMGGGGHEEPHATMVEDDGHDESWVRIPAEGWAPLHRLDVRVAA